MFVHNFNFSLFINIMTIDTNQLVNNSYNEAKKLGVKLVSLGKRILRTETAAIAVMTSIIYHYGDFRD